jgi:hypothetical protein
VDVPVLTLVAALALAAVVAAPAPTMPPVTAVPKASPAITLLNLGIVFPLKDSVAPFSPLSE